MRKINAIRKSVIAYGQELAILSVALIFFVASSSYLLLTQSYSTDPVNTPDFVKWVSPDETANYVFAKLYAQEGRLSLEEKYNLEVDDIMRPRSFRSDHGQMKPVSFLGIMLIYGKIASVFGYEIIPFLTPFFASLGLVFYYLLIRKIFGRQNAFWSTLLLASFPPFLYYSMRSMFHNVLFTVLLIISLYYAYRSTEGGLSLRRWRDMGQWRYFRFYFFAALAGAFLALSVSVRTSELLWLGPLFLLLWLLNLRRFGILRPIFFVAAFLLAIMPLLAANQKLYGAFFYGGYPEMNSSIHTLAGASGDLVSSGLGAGADLAKRSLNLIKETIFHFGLDVPQSRVVFSLYFKSMFPWIFWPALLGMLFFALAFRQSRLRQWYYVIGLGVLSLILVVYYGSWDFHDNPDPNAVTIGNSYTRYWLPIYLGFIPFASLALMWITRMLCALAHGKLWEGEDLEGEVREGQLSMFPEETHGNYCRYSLRLVIVVFLTLVSVRFVLYGSAEGIVKTIANMKNARAEWEEVLELTENNSAIVTRYHDKLFFPERKVIVGIFDDKNMNDRYGKLAEQLPLYYYNFSLQQADLDYLNARKLRESGLKISLVKKINDSFSLYKLSPLKE